MHIKTGKNLPFILAAALCGLLLYGIFPYPVSALTQEEIITDSAGEDPPDSAAGSSAVPESGMTVPDSQNSEESAVSIGEEEPAPPPENQEPADVQEISRLYCYTVLPGYTGPMVNVDDNAVWNGMGVGVVAASPDDYEVGTSFSLEQLDWSAPPSLPPIEYTLGSETLTLTWDNSMDPAPYTYSVEWSKIVVAHGANTGHNDYNPTVPYWQNAFHLNGFIHLNIPDKYTVNFAVQQPGQSGFSVAAADSFEVDAGTPLSSIAPHPPG